MKIKYTLKTLASLLSLIPLLIAGVASASPGQMVIGVSSALSGEGANYGRDVKDAVLFADSKFGKGRYKIIFEDDKCSGRDAVTIAHKFINVDKVDFVLGFACSGAMLAAAPVYEQAKIPVMVTCASSPKIAKAGDYIYRTFPSDKGAAERLYQHVSTKHKLFGIITEETQYAQDLSDAFLKAAGSNPAFETRTVDFIPKTSDFRSLLLKLKKSGVEGLFVNTQAEGTFVVVIKQIAELGWSIPVYGAYWPSSPAFLKEAGKLAEGIEFVDTPSLDFLLNKKGRLVYKEYKAKYPPVRSIEAVFATTFEGFRAMDSALSGGGDVQRFFEQHTFQGIFGSYSFDSDGEIKGVPFMMKKIANGKAVPL